MTLKSDAKFKGKLNGGLKNDIRNLVNFHVSSRKTPFVQSTYKVLDEKVQKSYVS